MSINALAVEALPAGSGSARVSAVRGRIDRDLADLTQLRLQGSPDPLDLAAWARAAQARLEAFRLAALAEAEEQGAARKAGALGTAAWLKGQGSGAKAARRDVKLAGALAEPAHAQAREALASGRVGAEQTAVVTAATDALSGAVSLEQRDAFEARLLAQAETLDPWLLEKAARREAARVDPSGSGDLARAEKAARSQRELVIYSDRGRYVLAGQLDAEGAAYLSAALDPLAAPRPSGLDGADPRTPSRRLGDALVELATRQLAAGELPPSGGTATTVVVTMTLEQLLAADAGSSADVDSPGAAEVRGGTVDEPLSAARARRLACDARLLPAVLGGASEILDWGRAKRLATPAQRAALALRDGGCTFPGCRRPPAWCETHHLVPWLSAGLTDLANLALVCDAHHDLLHSNGWTLTYRPDVGVRWHPPADRDNRLTQAQPPGPP
jgi:hypothetical protein